MPEKPPERRTSRQYAIDLGRAFGGALVFSIPSLMTMEMWWLGFSSNGFRLALFVALTLPLLTGLSYFEGFEDTFGAKDDILDTFTAITVGFIASALMLFMFGVLTLDMSMDEIVGKIAVQTVVAALGAMFAESLLGTGGSETEEHNREKIRSASYYGQIFLMMVGAVYLSLTLAATEEIVLIAYQMSSWQSIALVLFSLAVMHGFVYAVKHARGETNGAEESFVSVFLRFTVVGYVAALLVGAYILWTFGRTDETGAEEALKAVIVLGFPAALGAAASRLIL
jgi:putative integral membrane protein (TIGR02587 family)